MGAPNPWFKGSPPLSSSEILKEGEHPLDLIRDFILNWPGEETVKFDFETRHNRLIQIIAGYPEIDVGRYPLDWPLSKKANDALRLNVQYSNCLFDNAEVGSLVKLFSSNSLAQYFLLK